MRARLIAVIIGIVTAGALVTACSKKKADTTPKNTDTTTDTGTGSMGGDTYAGDSYGNPCEGANPCGM